MFPRLRSLEVFNTSAGKLRLFLLLLKIKKLVIYPPERSMGRLGAQADKLLYFASDADPTQNRLKKPEVLYYFTFHG